MKSKIFFVRVCAFVLAASLVTLIIVMLTATSVGREDSIPRLKVLSGMPEDKIPGATTSPYDPLINEGIPYYPGARVERSNQRDAPGGGVYLLRSEDSLENIAAFYRESLAKNGWVLTEESLRDTPGISMKFVWTNASLNAPARRYLTLGVDKSNKWDGVEIFLDFQRWPDPNKLPMYPGAEHIVVKTIKDPTYGIPQRITVYSAQASRDKVSAFYSEEMLQHGWQLIDNSDNPNSKLIFSYQRGSQITGTGSHITVSLTETSSDQTEIELTAVGGEVTLPAAQSP